ncbi:MAG TPA: hemolysin family protein, partial [Anaerolineae bacterium]|nr:hemolysin family protein [Anaerolineae bacterium]
MTQSLGTEFIILAVLISLNAFFAMSEIAIISVPKLRLKQLMEDGNKTAKVLFHLADDSSRFLATTQIGVTLVGFLASATAAVSLSDGLARAIASLPLPGIASTAHGIAITIITIILAIFTLILGELVPKSIALQHTERIAMFVARPVDLLSRIFNPLVRFPVGASNLITKPFGGKPRRGMPIVTEEEIKTMVDAGEEGGVLEEDEKDMIYSIFEFGDTLAREVMISRMDIVALEAATPVLDAIELVTQHNHSRVPIYKDNIDNIIGILYAKDLLKVLREKGREAANQIQLSALVRPASFTPETKKVDELLEEMQKRRVHMAIVIDEYGGTAGLVTIEDILEEIVGEIQDEYDQGEESLIQTVSDSEWIVDARANLNDVNQLIQADMPVDVADTLGGFVYSQLGKVPLPGDEVHHDAVV